MNKKKKPSRGRPQTLIREDVLRIALMRYWADGPKNISINDICEESGASKPSVYREFGSDDGFKVAVLETYADKVLKPLFDILASDQHFRDAVDALIEFTTQDRKTLGLPNGCLHAVMRTQRNDFGPLTQKKIDGLRIEILERYIDWIDRAKARDQFGADMSTKTAALYFDAHNGSVMRMQKEGVQTEVIKEIMRKALSVFV